VNRRLRHTWLLILLIPFLTGCDRLFKAKRMDERITLKKSDKIPYGTFVAFKELENVFPVATVTVNQESPANYTSFTSEFLYGSDVSKRKALYIIITPEFQPDQKEYDALMRFVNAGNHIFISTLSWGRDFTDSLKLKIYQRFTRFDFSDSLTVSIKNPVTNDSMEFAYPGKSDFTYFIQYDSNYSQVMGHDDVSHPNLIRQSFPGGGSITVQSDPLALSNFFLLHKKNMAYYDEVFSYFPKNIDAVVWDQYFRYTRNGRNFNSLQVILSNRNLRPAFWLAVILFALIYLFESKRKQRIIPIVKPHKNASLDFVKTVGRLYHQYHDNKNLGSKMTAHLLEYIRQKYQVPTTALDQEFIARLAFKSGYPKDKVHDLIYKARMINDFESVNDAELMEFHRQTEDFYKYQ